MQSSTRISKVQNKMEKQKYKKKHSLQRRRELRNKGRESIDMSPQALAQSKRKPEKKASSWSSDLSKSSNVRQLRSLQIHHIKHNVTKFQM